FYVIFLRKSYPSIDMKAERLGIRKALKVYEEETQSYGEYLYFVFNFHNIIILYVWVIVKFFHRTLG
ncbi:unnamed protein product, partial [marine sediment metagenome]